MLWKPALSSRPFSSGALIVGARRALGHDGVERIARAGVGRQIEGFRWFESARQVEVGTDHLQVSGGVRA